MRPQPQAGYHFMYQRRRCVRVWVYVCVLVYVNVCVCDGVCVMRVTSSCSLSFAKTAYFLLKYDFDNISLLDWRLISGKRRGKA